MKIVLSIIIPVYNTEKYLRQCIDSCLHQDLHQDEYEIILVDDGSSDRSADILKSYSKKYPNVFFFKKANGGVSSARNLGLKKSKGEFVTFIDSDDEINKHTLGRVFSENDLQNDQILILNSLMPRQNESQRRNVFPLIVDGDRSGCELYQLGYFRGSACGVIFKKEFLKAHDLFFPPGVQNGEDSLFMAVSLALSTSVRCLDVNFYLISLRPGSLSRSWSYQKAFNLVSNLKVIEEYILRHNFSNQQLGIMGVASYQVISNGLHSYFRLNEFGGYKRLRKLIYDSSLYPINTHGLKLFRGRVLLLNFSIDLFSFLVLVKARVKAIIRASSREF